MTKQPDKTKFILFIKTWIYQDSILNMNISWNKSTLLVRTTLVTLPLYVIRKIVFIILLSYLSVNCFFWHDKVKFIKESTQ